jgi:hypothetical protein
MKHVYIVQDAPEPYEAENIYGIFSSLKKAKQCFKDTNRNYLVIYKVPINTYLFSTEKGFLSMSWGTEVARHCYAVQV